MKGTLASRDRRTLKQAAHGLDPVVMVGKEGVCPSLLKAVDAALEAHELIKVRFVEFKDERKPMTGQVAADAGAVVVGVIGHVAILYRPREDLEKRTYGITLS
ncbi:MAG: ribosome assembly RNA-binding protein YhbY [Gemmatimonadetes bacterium]|nr:ribosome assembly RNA-binding protein YhbY [Gemmatimonadota bacterium]|tara:strand:- start:2170 stop:2478 length:309 start_codon:yes stop_codon:yes gene_type:complete